LVQKLIYCVKLLNFLCSAATKGEIDVSPANAIVG
jgi:hypothetical protein